MSTEALGAASAALSSIAEPSLAPLQGAMHAGGAGASGTTGAGFSSMVTQGRMSCIRSLSELTMVVRPPWASIAFA